MYLSELRPPKKLRDWLIGIAIFVLVAGGLILAYQPRVEHGEQHCRSTCAADGAKGYVYRGPSRWRPENCTCMGRSAR